MKCGHLKLYRSDGLDYWDSSKAKNTAHTVPDDTHHMLCNVDGDNLLTLEFGEQSLSVAARIRIGEVGCARFTNPHEYGTCGRIMIDGFIFRMLGGHEK